MEHEVKLVLETTEAPEWIRLLPVGRVELVDGREPFEVDPETLAAMVTAFKNRGVDLVIDYEHQTIHGDKAPAAGWIKALEAREDGLWARVEWTAQARKYLAEKEYRYFSPVLRLDPDTRKPTALLHVALTNVPAIKDLPPLVAKWGAQSDDSLAQTPHPGLISPQPADLGGLLSALSAQQARSQKYGIGVKEGGRGHKPVELSEVADDDWGDPVNYRFPCHTQEAAQEAWEEWCQPEQQSHYTPKERARVARRLRWLLARYGITAAAEEEPQKMKEALQVRFGLDPEDDDTLLWQKLDDFWRDLALTLNLAPEADVSQLKGAVEALKAGCEMTMTLREENQRMKELLAEEEVNKAVAAAMQSGKISPAQKAWAMEYCRRDPAGFQTYVAQVGPVVPVATKLSLQADHSRDRALTPTEIAICRQLNLPEGRYQETKMRLTKSREKNGDHPHP